MSIKDQLRAAILSGGATAAIPNNIEISIGNLKEGSNPFVVPDHGYVVAAVTGNASKAAVRLTSSRLEACSHKNNATGEVAASASLLAKKGDIVDIVLTDVTKVYFARFVKLVGGGKIPVAQSIWRAVPCLRNSFTKRLIPILKASLHGLQRKQLRQGRKLLKSRFQILTGTQSTTRQKQGGTTSSVSLGREGSVASMLFPTIQTRRGCPTTAAGKTLRICLPLKRSFRKGRESLSGCMRSLSLSQGSFLLSAVNKPVLGGASYE